MKSFIKKFFDAYASFAFLGVVIIILQVNIDYKFADDPNLAKWWVEKDFNTIFTINARYLINIVTGIISSHNIILWKALNIFFVELLALSVSRLINIEKNFTIDWLIVGFIIMYPFVDMSSSGWIVATGNYIWTLSTGIYTLEKVNKSLKGIKLKWFEVIVSGFATYYSANFELMTVILMIFCVLGLIRYYQIYKKKNVFIIFQIFVISGSLLYILSAASIKARYNNAIIYFPDYKMLSLIDKAMLGFTTTMSTLIARHNTIFLIFTILLACMVIFKCKHFLLKIISLIPIVITYICSFQIYGSIDKIMKYTDPKFGMSDYRRITAETFDKFSYYIPIFISILTLGCLLISLWAIGTDVYESFLYILIFGAGLCSRIVLGFSPTVYASSMRTFVFLYFGIIICSIMIIRAMLISERKSFVNIVFCMIGVLSLCTLYDNYIQIYNLKELLISSSIIS